MSDCASYTSILPEFTDRLKKAGVFSPDKDARAILGYVLSLEEKTNTSESAPLTEQQIQEKCEPYIQRREKREPLTRILGVVDFYGVTIHVENNVFRPCPEIEGLVEVALALLEDKKEEPLRLLDLGTGSGCILLALLSKLPNATGVGIDIEENILETAEKNAAENNLSDRASFQLGNWGNNIDEKFDILICNPPAIPTNKIAYYPPEMSAYNPISSIDGGEDGLCFYKNIVQDFKRITNPNGLGIFRIYSKTQEASLFQKAGLETQIIPDYQGNAYCLVVRKKERPSSLWQRILGFWGQPAP